MFVSTKASFFKITWRQKSLPTTTTTMKTTTMMPTFRSAAFRCNTRGTDRLSRRRGWSSRSWRRSSGKSWSSARPEVEKRLQGKEFWKVVLGFGLFRACPMTVVKYSIALQFLPLVVKTVVRGKYHFTIDLLFGLESAVWQMIFFFVFICKIG